MKLSSTIAGLLPVLLFTAFASAQAEGRRLTIQSAQDRFDVVLTSASATVNGRAADMTSFRDLIPMLTNPLGNECPAFTGEPEVSVTEAGQTKKIYISQGIITDGKNCLNVGGDGLLYFPVHRDFLIGPKRGSIPLRSPVKITVKDGKTIELKSSGRGWTSDDKETLLNWDFLERFESSLKNHDIRMRVQTEISKGKNSMTLQSGGETYRFYKISNVLWAVKRPGQNWLEASDDWGFWYELDSGILEDRFAGQIRFLEDGTREKADRIKAMKKIGDGWSKNLRDLYHKFLNDSQEDEEIQKMALQRLRTKPSMETSGVVVEFMNRTANEDLKKLCGQILKAGFPKGPLYNPKATAKEKAKTLRFWNNWWNQRKGKA